jgi:hypothetical protein
VTALDLLQQLRDLGVVLTPYPDRTLRYKAPKGTLTPALVDGMHRQKAELHALVEEWSERAAIMEYDGGLPRAEAEGLAWDCPFSRVPDAARLVEHAGDDMTM